MCNTEPSLGEIGDTARVRRHVFTSLATRHGLEVNVVPVFKEHDENIIRAGKRDGRIASHSVGIVLLCCADYLRLDRSCVRSRGVAPRGEDVGRCLDLKRARLSALESLARLVKMTF